MITVQTGQIVGLLRWPHVYEKFSDEDWRAVLNLWDNDQLVHAYGELRHWNYRGEYEHAVDHATWCIRGEILERMAGK